MRDSSPSEDVDLCAAESEVPTEVESDDFVVVGGKRIPLSSYDPRYVFSIKTRLACSKYSIFRALKRQKAYSSFSEVRPTIRNKPSGLVNNWPQALAKTSAASHRRTSLMSSTPSPSLHSATPPPSLLSATPSPSTSYWSSSVPTPSTSSSSLSAVPSPSPSYWQPQPSPVMPNVDSFNPVISAPDTITPFLDQQSFPFHLNMQNHQSVNDTSQQIFHTNPAVHSFSRKHKDEAGRVQVPGLKDLPYSIQSNFRNTFIRHIMKLVFSDAVASGPKGSWKRNLRWDDRLRGKPQAPTTKYVCRWDQ
jgi:hypothetical protein